MQEAVYSPALTDFVFMVDNISYMFITGPQVIKAVTGEEVSPEKLGGAATHNDTSGVAHFRAKDEQECFTLIAKLLSYLPSNNINDPPAAEPAEPALPADDLVNLVPADPNKGYDVVEVIKRVVDNSELFQVHEHYAKNAVIGFARIAGQAVGSLRTSPNFGGCLDINSSDKIAALSASAIALIFRWLLSLMFPVSSRCPSGIRESSDMGLKFFMLIRRRLFPKSVLFYAKLMEALILP